MWMTTHEWQLYVSGLTDDQWMKILVSQADYEFWVSEGRPTYARFNELRGQRQKKA